MLAVVVVEEVLFLMELLFLLLCVAVPVHVLVLVLVLARLLAARFAR